MPGDDEVYQLMMEGYKFSEEEFRLLGVYDRMLVDIMEEDGSGSTKIPLNISLFEIPAIMQKKFVGMHFASFLVGTKKKQMIFSNTFLPLFRSRLNKHLNTQTPRLLFLGVTSKTGTTLEKSCPWSGI